METLSLDTLRILAEVPPDVLRALGEVPVEVLRALRDVPPAALKVVQPEEWGRRSEPSGVGWSGEGSDELTLAIDHVDEVMKRTDVNVVGAFGKYRPNGQGWWNVYIDSGGGGVDRLLEKPGYQVAQAFAVLGSEVRLAILRSLFDAPKTVAELVAALGLGTTGQAYHHLRELERVNAVEARDGKYHFNGPFARIYLTALLVAHDIGAITQEPDAHGSDLGS